MPNVIEAVEQIKSNLPTRDVDGAIKLAHELIDKLEIKTYPVPIIDILNGLNINTYVSEMPKSSISGFIIIKDDDMSTDKIEKIISVNINDPYDRQRFTFAHEFGHFLFDYRLNNREPYFDTYDLVKTDEVAESIPSRFAAEFLMPAEMFKKRYKELKGIYDDEDKIAKKLSEDFEVGYKSVLKRLQELHIICEDRTCLAYAK